MNKGIFRRSISGILALSLMASNMPAVFAESTDTKTVSTAVYNGEPLFSIAEGEDYSIYTRDFDMETGLGKTESTVLFSTKPNPDWVSTLSDVDIRTMYWLDSASELSEDNIDSENEEVTKSLTELYNDIENAKARVIFARDTFASDLASLEEQTEALYSKIAGADTQIGLDLYLALNDETSTINQILSGNKTAYAFIWGAKNDAESNSLVYNYTNGSIPVNEGASGTITKYNDNGTLQPAYHTPMSPVFPSKVFDFDVEASQKKFKSSFDNLGSNAANAANYFKNYTPVVKPAWYSIQFTSGSLDEFNQLKDFLKEWIKIHEDVTAINAVPLLNDYFLRDSTYFKPAGFTDMATVKEYFDESTGVMNRYLNYMLNNSTSAFRSSSNNNNNNTDVNNWRNAYDSMIAEIKTNLKFEPVGEWVPIATEKEVQRRDDLEITISDSGSALVIPDISLDTLDNSLIENSTLFDEAWYKFMSPTTNSVGSPKVFSSSMDAPRFSSYSEFKADAENSSSTTSTYSKLVCWYVKAAIKYGLEYADRGVCVDIFDASESDMPFAKPYFLTPAYILQNRIKFEGKAIDTPSMAKSPIAENFVLSTGGIFNKDGCVIETNDANGNVTKYMYTGSAFEKKYIDINLKEDQFVVNRTYYEPYAEAYRIFYQNINNYKYKVTGEKTSDGTKIVDNVTDVYDLYKIGANTQYEGYCDINVAVEPSLGTVTYTVGALNDSYKRITSSEVVTLNDGTTVNRDYALINYTPNTYSRPLTARYNRDTSFYGSKNLARSSNFLHIANFYDTLLFNSYYNGLSTLNYNDYIINVASGLQMNVATENEGDSSEYTELLTTYSDTLAEHSMAIDAGGLGMDFFTALDYLPVEFYGGSIVTNDSWDKYKRTYNAFCNSYNILYNAYKELLTLLEESPLYATYAIADNPEDKYNLDDLTQIGIEFSDVPVSVKTKSIMDKMLANDWSIMANLQGEGRMAEITPFMSESSYKKGTGYTKDIVRNVGSDTGSSSIVLERKNPVHPSQRVLSSSDLEELWSDYNYVAGSIELPEFVTTYSNRNSELANALNKVKYGSQSVKLSSSGISVQVYQVDTATNKTVIYPSENTAMFNSSVNNDKTVDISKVFQAIKDYEYADYETKARARGDSFVHAKESSAWYSETHYNNRYNYIVLVRYLYTNDATEPWIKLPIYFTLETKKDLIVSEIPEYAISEYYDTLENVPALSTTGALENEVFAVNKLNTLLADRDVRRVLENAGAVTVLDINSGVKPISFVYKLRDIAKIARSFNLVTNDSSGKSTAKIVTTAPKRSEYSDDLSYQRALADQWNNLLSVYSYYTPYQNETFGKNNVYYKNGEPYNVQVEGTKQGTGYTTITAQNAHSSITTGDTLTYEDAINNIYNYHILRYENSDLGKSYRTVQRILLDIEPFFNILTDDSRNMVFYENTNKDSMDFAISEHTMFGSDYRPDLRWTENGAIASYYYMLNNGPTNAFPMDFYQWYSKVSDKDGLYLYSYADGVKQGTAISDIGTNIKVTNKDHTHSEQSKTITKADTNYRLILGGVSGTEVGDKGNIQLSTLKMTTSPIKTDVSYSDWIFSKSVYANSDVYLCLSCGMLLYKDVLHDHFMQEGTILVGWSQTSDREIVYGDSYDDTSAIALDLAPEMATTSDVASFREDVNGTQINANLPYLIGWKIGDSGLKEKVLVPVTGTYETVGAFYKEAIPFYYSPIASNLQLALGLRHTSVYHMQTDKGKTIYIEPIPMTAEDNYNYYAYYNAVKPLLEGSIAGLHVNDEDLVQSIKSLRFIDDSLRIEYYFNVKEVGVPGIPKYQKRVVASCNGPFVNVLNWDIDTNYGLDSPVVDVYDTTVNINSDIMSEAELQNYINTIWDMSSRENEDKQDDNENEISDEYVNAYFNLTGKVVPDSIKTTIVEKSGTKEVTELVYELLSSVKVHNSPSGTAYTGGGDKANVTTVNRYGWVLKTRETPFRYYSIPTTLAVRHNTYNLYGAGTILKGSGNVSVDEPIIDTERDYKIVVEELYSDIMFGNLIHNFYNDSYIIDGVPRVQGIINKNSDADGVEVTKDRINTSRRSELAYTSGVYRLNRNYTNTQISNMAAMVAGLKSKSIMDLSIDDMLVLSSVSANTNYLIPISLLEADIEYLNNIGLAGVLSRVNISGDGAISYDIAKHCYVLTVNRHSAKSWVNEKNTDNHYMDEILYTSTQLSDKQVAMSRLLAYGWVRPYLASDTEYGYFITSNYWGKLTRDSLDSLLKATRSVSARMASVVDFNNMVMTLPSTINSTGGLPRLKNETLDIADYKKFIIDSCKDIVGGIETYYVYIPEKDSDGNNTGRSTLEAAAEDFNNAVSLLSNTYKLPVSLPQTQEALQEFITGWAGTGFIAKTLNVYETAKSTYSVSANWGSFLNKPTSGGPKCLNDVPYNSADNEAMETVLKAVCEYLNILVKTSFVGIDLNGTLTYNKAADRYEAYVVKNTDGRYTFTDTKPVNAPANSYSFVIMPTIYTTNGTERQLTEFLDVGAKKVFTSRNIILQHFYNGMYLNFNYDVTDLSESLYTDIPYSRQEALQSTTEVPTYDRYGNKIGTETRYSYNTSITDINRYLAAKSNASSGKELTEAETELLEKYTLVVIAETFALQAMKLSPFIVVDVTGDLTVQDFEQYSNYEGMSIYAPYKTQNGGNINITNPAESINSVYRIVKFSSGDSVYTNVNSVNDSSLVLSKTKRGSDNALTYGDNSATYFEALGSGSATNKSYELMPNRGYLLASDRLVRIRQGAFEYISSIDDWGDEYTKPETSILATGAGEFTPIVFIDNIDLAESTNYFVNDTEDKSKSVLGYQFDNTYRYDVQDNAEKQSNSILHVVSATKGLSADDAKKYIDKLMKAQLSIDEKVENKYTPTADKFVDGITSSSEHVDVMSYGYKLVPEVLMTYKTGFRYVDGDNSGDVIRWIQPDFESTLRVKPNISPAYKWALNNWSNYYTVTTGTKPTAYQLNLLADAYARAQRGNIKTAYVAGYDEYTMALPAYNKISLKYDLTGDAVGEKTGTTELDGRLAETDGNTIKIGSTGIAVASGAKNLRNITGDVQNPKTWSANKGTYKVETVPVILTGATMTANMQVAGNIQLDSWVVSFNKDKAPAFLNESVDYSTMGKNMADAWLRTLRDKDDKFIMTADLYNKFTSSGTSNKPTEKDVLNTSISMEIDDSSTNKDYTVMSDRVTFEVRNGRLAVVRVEKYNADGSATGVVDSYVVYANGNLTTSKLFDDAKSNTDTIYDGVRNLYNDRPDVFNAIVEMKLVEFAGTLRDTTGAAADTKPQNFASAKPTDSYNTDMYTGTTGIVGKDSDGKPVAELKTVEDIVNEARKEWGQTIDSTNSWYQEDTTIFQIEHYTKTIELPKELNFSWKIPVSFGAKGSSTKTGLYNKDTAWLGDINVGVRFGDEDYARFDVMGTVYDNGTSNVLPYKCFKISNATVNDR